MELSDKYIQFAEIFSGLQELEAKIYNKKRLIQNLSEEFKNNEKAGCIGIEFTAHAFKQISERLEEIGRINPIIYKDVFKPEDPSSSLLIPSNLKSFVITLLADANKKRHYHEEESKSSRSSGNALEYRYTIDMKKWSNEKKLQFVAIVENNCIKTGFFNWV